MAQFGRACDRELGKDTQLDIHQQRLGQAAVDGEQGKFGLGRIEHGRKQQIAVPVRPVRLCTWASAQRFATPLLCRSVRPAQRDKRWSGARLARRSSHDGGNHVDQLRETRHPDAVGVVEQGNERAADNEARPPCYRFP